VNEPEIKVAFLDVGQGDSTIVVLPDRSSAIVVDCPRAPIAVDYLEKVGVNTLNYVFLTHTDLDHIGGVVELLENFMQFGYVGGIGYNHDTPKIACGKRRIILRQLAQLIRRHGWDVCSPRSGQSWMFQGVAVDVLHPDDLDMKQAELMKNKGANNASVMLRITFASRRVLLTADIESQGWQWVIRRGTDLQADVLKFPHHGAWYDASDQQYSLSDVLQQVNPSLAIISVGTHNRYEHPKLKTLELLRSYPQLRFMCTEATPKCYSSLKNAREKKAYPCAGTVEVVIGNNLMMAAPDCAKHAEIIKRFDIPQCKKRELGD
jgi:competence protein ComEC